MTAPKIIVLGSLNGQLEPALKKLATLHAKNSFSLAILTGDVFNPDTSDETLDTLLNGSIDVPLPTYFTVGIHPLPPRIAEKVEADEEICYNLHYLAKRSVTKTSEGVRIACLGGQLDPNVVGGQSKEQHLPFHSTEDAKSLRGANSADILLTSSWPAGIWSGSKVALDPKDQASLRSTEDIAELCAALRPSYHLSASPGDFFYEREPFVHPAQKDSDEVSITRFISMAPYGNQAKAKAMYAFTLNKSDASVPVGATASPFFKAQKRSTDTDGSYSRFANGHHEDRGRGRHGKRRRQRSPPPGPDMCYFCMGKPNFSAHMVCSIGEDAYITTAKGPLTTSSTFASQGLDFPVHMIITPLSHAPTIHSMATVDGEAKKTFDEMNRFREATQSAIAAKSSYKMGMVSWEISRERNVHLNQQLLAIPASLIRDGLVEAAFKVEAENLNYAAFVAKDLSIEDQASYGDFFSVKLWADDGENKIKGKSLVMPLTPDMRFDLQFGRRVLAKLLGLEDRLIWQDCPQTVEEETKDVEAFRETFQPYDFTE